MKKTLLGIAGGSLLTLVMAAPSFAATLGTNSNQQASHSMNCIAVYSAQVTHNGSAVSVQAQSGMRGSIVQGLQDTCNFASSK